MTCLQNWQRGFFFNPLVYRGLRPPALTELRSDERGGMQLSPLLGQSVRLPSLGFSKKKAREKRKPRVRACDWCVRASACCILSRRERDTVFTFVFAHYTPGANLALWRRNVG